MRPAVEQSPTAGESFFDTNAWFEMLVPAVDELAEALIPLAYKYNAQINDARKDSDTYARLREEARDIYDFANNILAHGDLAPAHLAAQNILDTFSDVVIKHGFGSQHKNAYGLAIYLPSTNYRAAYSDPDKFPTGPYCKEGDFVIFRSYSGTRFKIAGKEFRLINDDTVEAVVDDPREYTRA